MSIHINHIAVAAEDKTRSATFLATLLGLPEPTGWGPFLSVRLEDGFQCDYAACTSTTRPATTSS